MTELRTSELRTSDLYFAAFLQCDGHELMRLDREGPTRVIFVFGLESEREVQICTKRYFGLSGMVPALTYAHHVKALKALVHA